jgi:PKD repeat protein
MKTFRGIFGLILAVTIMFSGCKKDDNSPPAELEIIATFINANTVLFEHNGAVTGIPSWDFGNGQTSDKESDTIVYPYAGTYTVNLSIFASDGEKTATTEVTITTSDPSLVQLTPDETLLCGGADNANGKTWVWARYVPQHIMLGQADPWQWWYGSEPDEKAGLNIYDDKMIFKAVNYEFDLINNDTTYVNVDRLSDFDVEGTEDTPVYYDLSEQDFTWAIEERGDQKFLKFTGGGFMSYYLGVNEYEIIKLTENELTLSVIVDNALWTFIFKQEGYDHPDAVDPEQPVTNENLSPATNTGELSDDFESESQILWLFQDEGGGGSGNDEASNPDASGINTSSTVYEYIKGSFEYSNAYMELGFDIDLTVYDKVRMKVYFPSGNDYSGDLKTKASVKLQNWEESQPWVNQAEVIIEDIATDEWVELTFDFTSITIPEERLTDYFNRIVIQFGDEGHTVDGTFYFDDFQFLTAE